MISHRHPIFCILPPHILKEIVDQGTPVQREWAVKTLRISDQLRVQRVSAGSVAAPAAQEGAIAGVKQRTVYDAQQGSTLPGNLVRKEGEPPIVDVGVNEAYDGAGFTYDLYWEVYQRNSIDNQGMVIESSVHYQQNYDNAFWNGSQMVYGDGDANLPPDHQLFNRFTICLDVIGHELTHGVTQYTAGLNYQDQSGALNESISDVFGSLVKQHHLAQGAAEADWIIGQGLLSPNVKGVGIRSMKAPGTAYDDPVLGKDPQPANMKDYKQMAPTDDSGGVHINSGIPNYAFYVTAVTIGGNAWEKAGRIWYTALRDQLRPTSNFQDAANLTLSVAGQLYGNGSLEQQGVQKGWADAGITAAVIQTTGTGCLDSIRNLLGMK